MRIGVWLKSTRKFGCAGSAWCGLALAASANGWSEPPDDQKEGIMKPDTSRERKDGKVILYNADRDAKTAAEYRGLCERLRQSIEEDRLPADEAYWWTRIALVEAGLLHQTAA
jgi:hypothetical protein